MAKEVFAGRRNLKREFAKFLTTLVAQSKDAQPQSPSPIQGDEATVHPRIVLLSGHTGTGKSAALDQCLDQARSLSLEIKKPIKVFLFDGADSAMGGRAGPATIIDALHSVVIDEEMAATAYFTEYNQVKQRIAHVKDTVEYLLTRVWQEDKCKVLASPLLSEEAAADKQLFDGSGEFFAWLHDNKKLPDDEMELYGKSDLRLSKSLVNGFIQLSGEYPVVLAIDAYEQIVDGETADWLQDAFFSKLFERKGNILVIISGKGNFLKAFRNNFQEEMLYAVNFDDLLLSRAEIGECAAHCQVKFDQKELFAIEDTSRGIPFLVRNILGLVKSKAALPEILRHKRASDISIDEIAYDEINRFLIYCPDDGLKKKLIHCSLMYNIDGNALSKLWSVAYADVSKMVSDLSMLFPFVSCNRMYEKGNLVFRKFLIKEAGSGTNAEVTAIVKEYAALSGPLFLEQIGELVTAIPVFEKRWDDKRYQNAVLAHCNSLLWGEVSQVFAQLAGIILECRYFNQPFGLRILECIREFSRMLSENQMTIVGSLHTHFRQHNPLAMWLSTLPTKEDTWLLAYFEENAASFTGMQRALLLCYKGQILFRTNRELPASDAFEQSLLMAKDSAMVKNLVCDCLRSCAKVLSKMGNTARSIGVFKIIAESRLDDHEAWFDLGRAQTQALMHAEAIASYVKTVECKPDEFDAWKRLAREYYCLESFNLAAQAFEKSLRGHPGDATDWHKAGKSYQAIGQEQKALSSFKRAVDLSPLDIEFRGDLAQAFSVIGNVDAAATEFEEALRVAPSFTDAWLELGNIRLKQEKWQSAIDAYLKFLGANPDSQEGLYSIAQSYYAQAEYEKAAFYFGKVVERAPKHLLALYYSALSLHACKQYEPAIEYYKKTLADDGSNVDAMHNMARAFIAQRLYQDAVEILRKALAICPDKPQIWNDLGSAFGAMDLWAEATRCFKKLVVLDSAVSESWRQLGQAYFHNRQYEEALKNFNTAANIDPDGYLLWGNIGSTMYAMGNFDQAIECSVKALSIQPNVFWIEQTLAFASLLSGKTDDAKIAFEKIVSTHLQKDELSQVLAALSDVLRKNPELVDAQEIFGRLKASLAAMGGPAG